MRHFLFYFFLLFSCSNKTPLSLSPQEQQQAFELFNRHLMAIGGAQQLQAHQAYSIKGTMRELGSDITHEYHLQQRSPNLYYIRINLVGIGIFERGYDGSTFWERTPRGASVLSEEEQNKLLSVVDFYYDINYRRWYSSIKTHQQAEFAGQICDVVEVVTYNGEKEKIFFAKDTGLKVGVVRFLGTEDETIIRYGHYVEQDGIKIPLSKEEKMKDLHRIWMIDEFIWNKADSDFNPPPSLMSEQ